MNRLKDLRIAHGWQQSDVAKKLNVTKTTVSRYELGTRQLDPETICTLCDLFGCTSDYLLGRSSEPYAQFTPEDAKLVEVYHALPFEIRQAVDGLMAPYKEKEGRAVS